MQCDWFSYYQSDSGIIAIYIKEVKITEFFSKAL